MEARITRRTFLLLQDMLRGEQKVWSVVHVPTHLEHARLWDGTPLPPLLCARLTREWETVTDYTTRTRALLGVTDDPAIAKVRPRGVMGESQPVPR